MRTKRFAAIAALAAASMALVACAPAGDGGDAPTEEPTVSAEWAAVIEAAKEEGKLVWYGITPTSIHLDIEKAFEAAYPEIDLEIQLTRSAELDAAIEAERDTTGGADIISSVSHKWIKDHAAEGWFTPFTGPAILEEEQWSGDYLLYDDTVLAAPLGLIAMVWNTNLFPEGIDSFEDLLNPDLGDGAIGIPVPAHAVAADYWQFIEENTDEGFLEDLAKQQPKQLQSPVVMLEATVAGEVAVAIQVSSAESARLKSEGAPIDFLIPDPAWVGQNDFFILEWAEHPNAAQLFMNWLASPEGQAVAGKNAATPLAEVAPETLGGTVELTLTNVDRMVDQGWLNDYIARWHGIFG